MIDAKQEVNQMAAAYMYPKIFTGQSILLAVKAITKQGFRIVAIGYNNATKPIDKEIFEGEWSNYLQNGKGQWTHTLTGKKMSFTLRRIMTYKGIHLSTQNAIEGEMKPDQPFVFSVYFPEVDSRTQRAWIESVINVCQHDLDCQNSVAVTWHSADLISFNSSNWGYSQGMAHGNGLSEVKHFIPVNGKLTPVLLNHFLYTSTACIDRISKKIVQRLTGQKFSSAEQGAITNWKTTKFTPTPIGLGFSFDPYAVGSYAEGSAYVFITKSELASCLKKLPALDTITSTKKAIVR